MTALEMQFAALRNARHMVSTAPREKMNTADGVDDEAVKVLPTATPYAWSKEITRAVWLASKTIPEDAVLRSDVLPEGAHTCWWWFDEPLPIPMAHGVAIEGVDTRSISGLILSLDYERNTLLSIDARNTDMGPSLTGFLVLPLNVTLGQIISGCAFNPDHPERNESITPRAVHLIRFILAADVWLKQRIVSFASGHIERHRRKQIAREHNAPVPHDVKVVQLRRFEQSERGYSSDDKHIEWSCRWIVNGHWRNQPYKDGKKLIYIMPFVKGPAHQPLRVPSHTVYAVNR